MKFRIPSEIDIAGQTFQIHMDSSLLKIANCCGQTHFESGLILIDPSLRPEVKGVTYFHELVHAILITMGRDDLNRDEAFVDMMGNLIWQSFKSAKY